MTPEKAAEVLEASDSLSIVERDLDPDDARMGRAQFLISPLKSKQVIRDEFEDSELEVFKGENAPSQFIYIALPPN